MKAGQATAKSTAVNIEARQAPKPATGVEKQLEPTEKVSFANILVATDFSPVSDRALDYALSLARRYESKIYLTHIITSDTYQIMAPEFAAETRESVRAAAEKGMADVLVSGRMRGVLHEVVLEEGALWPSIEGLVEKYKIDLVVVGTQGLGAVKKMLIGSCAEQIFRQAKRPVLTVGPAVQGEAPSEVDFKTILFATDFGVGAEREAAYAFSLAQEHSAKLILLHVVPYAEDYSEEGLSLKLQAVKHELQELVPAGSENWCELEYQMKIGNAAEEILRTAKEGKADLIVMGAKKQKGLAGYVPHTKAYRVVSAAPCPVLTVRS
jgi:nucleotide-binding universal stress UspA family protein